jgi:hypothetical protein
MNHIRKGGRKPNQISVACVRTAATQRFNKPPTTRELSWDGVHPFPYWWLARLLRAKAMSVRRKAFRTLRRPGVPLNSEGCVDCTVATKTGRAAGARHIMCHTREPHPGYITREFTIWKIVVLLGSWPTSNESTINNLDQVELT